MTAASGAFVLGRDVGRLTGCTGGSDRVFAAERLDGTTLQDAAFEHSTFANISFKEVTLRSSRFLNCVFVGCYFRRSRVQDTSFVGCRFIDCRFPHVEVQSCDFRYALFQGCVIPFAEMQYTLPSEPNLCEDLAHNLAREAGALGETREAHLYRLQSIRARQQHLKGAVFASSSWYRTHYDLLGRLKAGARLVGSYLNGFLWGHGERWIVLARTWAIAAFVVFPLVFLAIRSQLTLSGDRIGFLELVFFSLDNMLSVSRFSRIESATSLARALASVEAVVGVLLGGLAISLVLRAIVRR